MKEDTKKDEISALLKRYRDEQGISQGELAKRLKVTQATVSRLESSKQNISKDIVTKINLLIFEPKINLPLLNRNDLKFFNLELSKDNSRLESKSLSNGFNYSYYSEKSLRSSGDFFNIIELNKKDTYSIIFGDTIGHGSGSSYMAFGLEFGHSVVSNVVNPEHLQPTFIDQILSSSVIKTSEKWKGEPSIIIANLDTSKATFSLINRGMPQVLVKTGKKIDFIKEGVYKALSLEEGYTLNQPKDLLISNGDSALIYSDGLSDFFTEDRLASSFSRYSKLFIGDSKAISKNLTREIKDEQKKMNSIDDISFLVMSRRS
jgi:transcriptional regulator with XRE-family HTH domain